MPAKARKTATRQIASPQDFKKKSRNRVELELPTGAVIIAKGITSMRTFLQSGVIPNGLMQIIQESIDKGKEPDLDTMLQPTGEDGKVDPGAIDDMLALIDNATVECWILPPTALPPEKDEEGNELTERSDEVLYTDEIDDQDKLFVFQWAIGGSDDLETFREEQAAGMGRLRSGKDVANQPK